MAKFEQCPANAQRKVRSGTFCEDYVLEHCEGCNMFTAYQIGRADAWKEALELQRKLDRQQNNTSRLDDDTWKEDMERDAQQYEAGE